MLTSLFVNLIILLPIGQAIPPGLHIRMNLQTGVKEAKLLDDEDEAKHSHSPQVMESPEPANMNKAVISVEKNDSEDEEETDPKAALMRDNIIEALKQIKSEDGLNAKVSYSGTLYYETL